MKNTLIVMWHGEEGQDLVEYAMMMGLIALAIVATMTSLGVAINTVFSVAGIKIAGS